jgi:predicted DNA-binding protein with PD1-like motif
MRSKLLDNTDQRRTIVLVFDINEEVVAGLLECARSYSIDGAYFSAIGALQDVTIGFWRWETKDYQKIPLNEQVEVLSMFGNLARTSTGEPKLHAHIVVGRADGSAHGGHLLEGHVRPTLEVMIIETPKELMRTIDPATGLPLLDIGSR